MRKFPTHPHTCLTSHNNSIGFNSGATTRGILCNVGEARSKWLESLRVTFAGLSSRDLGWETVTGQTWPVEVARRSIVLAVSRHTGMGPKHPCTIGSQTAWGANKTHCSFEGKLLIRVSCATLSASEGAVIRQQIKEVIHGSFHYNMCCIPYQSPELNTCVVYGFLM